MARKRGTYLTAELLEKLEDEMRRDRRSGSWILRDALEERYGIRPATPEGSSQDAGVDHLDQTGEILTEVAARKVTTETARECPDGVPTKSVSAAGITVTETEAPARAAEIPIKVREPPVIVTGNANPVQDRPADAEGVDKGIPHRPNSYPAVHFVPVHDGKLTRDLAEARTQLGLAEIALGVANLDRDRALAELEQARAETQSVRVESSARKAELVAALNRRPLLGRDVSRRLYVRVAARDSSGKLVVKTHRLAGHRFKPRRR